MAEPIWRPICQVSGCGAIILNPFAAVHLFVRAGPCDRGREILVCPDCAPKFSNGGTP